MKTPLEIFNTTLDRLPAVAGLLFYLWVLPGFADWLGLIEVPAEPVWLHFLILWPMLFVLALATASIAIHAAMFLSWPFRAIHAAWRRHSKE